MVSASLATRSGYVIDPDGHLVEVVRETPRSTATTHWASMIPTNSVASAASPVKAPKIAIALRDVVRACR